MDETFSNNNNNIPIEIVTDEEMAFIEAAYASVSPSLFIRSSSSSTPSSSPHRLLHTNAISINSITLLSKRRLSSSSSDIEDTLNFVNATKKPSLTDSLLRRFRRKRALSVTDLTSTVSSFFFFYFIANFQINYNQFLLHPILTLSFFPSNLGFGWN